MVSGEDQQQRAIERRRRTARDQAQPHGQLFDPSQGAQRLGLGVKLGAEDFGAGEVDRGNSGQVHQKVSRPAMAARAGMSNAASRAAAMSSSA